MAKQMKVRLTQHMAGPTVDIAAGTVLELDANTAARYCAKGVAVPYRGDDSIEYATSSVAAEAKSGGEPIHTGGGWWQLPDGRKVKGKSKAFAAWENA